MKVKLISIIYFLCLCPFIIKAQNTIWSTEFQSIRSYSSPRFQDNMIVFGGGIDGYPTPYGIIAINATDGTIKWTVPTRNEIFGSPIFLDCNQDNIKDVIISGRDAELRAINGIDGTVIWEFWNYPNINPNDSSWYNFYNPQIIPDQNNDNIPDILCANGGDHSLSANETNRPPGRILIIDSYSGNILKSAVVPDSNETYMSPLYVDMNNDNNYNIIFGTGGETIAGNLWIANFSDLINENLSSSIPLLDNPPLGVIAPPSLADLNNDDILDIISQSFDGKITAINGENLNVLWEFYIQGTESSASPIIGSFSGSDNNPDVFATLYKGTNSSYSDYYQILLDGASGDLIYIDSIGDFNFSTPVAFDSNSDGKDEILLSITNNVNGLFEHELILIDFINDTISVVNNNNNSGNIFSTPLIKDINNNNYLDIIYITQNDNPFVSSGIKIHKLETNFEIPIQGVSWGSYMGNMYDGIYKPFFDDCNAFLDLYLLPSISCPGQSSGSVDLIINNGTGPYTYSWSNGNVTQNIENLNPGNYTVIVADSNGCQDTSTIYVNQYTTTSLMQTVSCYGESDGWAYFNSSGCSCNSSNCQYTWSTGNDIIIQGDGSSSAQTHTYLYNLSAGTYTATIVHPDGCTIQSNIVVTEPPPIEINITTNNIICNGGYGSVSATTSGGTGNILLDWNELNTDSLLSGTYSVTATDANGCYQSHFFTIFEPDLLNLNIDSIIAPSCTGLYDGTVLVSASGGNPPYTFNDGGFGFTLNSGYYTISVYDQFGCFDNDVVFVPEPSPIVITTTKTDALCNGSSDGSATVFMSGGTSPYTEDWAGFNPDSLLAGVYIVDVYDANGCVSTDTVVINEPPFLTSFPTISYPVSCYGLWDGSIEVNPTGGVPPYFVNCTGGDINNMPAGVYDVTIFDANGCTWTSSQIPVYQPDELIIDITSENVSCYEFNDGEINFDINGGTPAYTCLWDNGITNSSATLNMIDTTYNLNNLMPGTYILGVMDNNNCSTYDTITITQPNEVTTSIIVGNNEPEYYSIETYSVAQTLGSFYDWNLSGGGIIISGLGTNSIDIQWNNVPDQYDINVVETDQNSCLGDSINLNVILQSGIGLNEINSSSNKSLIKIVDVLGREIPKNTKNQILFFIYDDGTIEKKIKFK